MAGSTLLLSKLLPGLDADLPDLRNDGLIRQMRRMKLEQFSRVGKELARRHAIHLKLRRVSSCPLPDRA